MTPELHQKLLELHYGLLPEGEASELRRQIETEPEFSQAFTEVQKTAAVFAQAAKVSVPKIILREGEAPAEPSVLPSYTNASSARQEPRPPKRPEQITMSTTPETSALQKLPRPLPVRRSFGRGANWFVGLAAAVLVMVSAGGYLYHRYQMATIAAEHLRLIVTGPSMLQSGVESQFDVSTTEITGDPLPAQVEFGLYSLEGKRLFGNKESTNEQGRLQVSIPADMSLPNGASIKFVVWNPSNKDEKDEFSAPLSVEPIHFATQLSLDKPLYQPGETIFYRSLTLSRFRMAADREFPLHFEILDPSGAAVANSQSEGLTERGVGNGSFQIPEDFAGGEYTLAVKSLDKSFPEEKRKFFIRRYRLPRLKKELEFARDSYAPGDNVVADFSAARAEGGPTAGAKLRIIATVDEQTVFEKNVQANDAGAYHIEFKLPDKIERGNGQLAAIIDDGGTSETLAKSIPINLGKVEVKFYPEGGDLVAGLENRVYFTAKNPLGKPVHIKGMVINERGEAVAEVETSYEGLGTFSFAPRPGGSYRLKIDNPAGVKEEAKLPPAMSDRFVVLNTGTGVFGPNDPLEFNLRSAKPNVPLVVVAWCRGVLVGQQPLVTQKNESGMNPVALQLPEGVGGVIRLTVFDYSDNGVSSDPSQPAKPPKPIAERLVYRRLAKKLTVQVGQVSNLSPNANDRLETCPTLKYSPGEKVKMSLVVTNEKGEPTPAALGVAVIDDALLSLADDHTPSMTTYFLLTTEIDKPEDLEKADFYLSDDNLPSPIGRGAGGEGRGKSKSNSASSGSPTSPHPNPLPKGEGTKVKPSTALDLLLGTQGWRRFAEKTLPELKQEGPEKDQLTRLVALSGMGGPPTLHDNLGQIRKDYEKSLEAYHAERTKIINITLVLCFILGLGLLLMVLMLGMLRMVRGFGFWLPALGATACCVLIASMTLAPSRFNLQKFQAVAFLPYHADTPAVNSPRSGTLLADDSDEDGVWFERFDRLDVLKGEKQDVDKVQDAKNEIEKFNWRFGGKNKDLAKKMPTGPIAGMPGGQIRQKIEEAKREVAGYELQMGGKPGMDDKERRIQNNNWFKADVDKLIDLNKYRFTVRQYSHEHVAGQPGVRSDFAETLYWNPLLIAGADGKAPLSFELSDSVTTFRLRVDAHGAGRIGSGGAEIVSRIPFNLEPKLPLEVNAGDRIDLPLAVVNDSPGELDIALKLEHGDLVKLEGDAERKLKLSTGQRGREYFNIDITGQKGDCPITIHGTAGSLADAVSRKLKIVPPGFPKNASYSGRIDGPQEVTVHLPERWVPGSLEVTLNAFPSTLASLQKGLDGILQEPNGCFEQASTSNYPNVMTMQYMEENNLADPAVMRRSKELLQKGYTKLTGYECKQKGYEWFGGDPGHEALTAYGLMQFSDMRRVYEVDDAMLKRTAEWLLARRDGKGGFRQNAKALDSFGQAPAKVADAYITWALCESGQKNIAAEVAHAVQLADKSDDAYVIALAAGAALDAGKNDEGKKLLEKITKQQADDGHLEGKLGSITHSGGVSLTVETTALAALAWLKQPAFAVQANKAVEWIVKQRQGGGGFGSTQATILALKALVEHAKANKKTLTAGKLFLVSKGVPVGEKEFKAGQQETISLGRLEAMLKPGDNSLTISLTGDNKMPYALDVSYRTLQPESDEKCPLRLKTSLAKPAVKAGETVALSAELTNTSDQGQPMTIAILGLPAGLEPRPDQLEELKKAGTIDYYETRSRELIFYWRSLAPKKQIAWKLDLIAAVPGKYTAPASRAYLYYTPEQKQWVEPLTVEISR